MVSPSKIFKTSNSGLKVGIDSSKKDGIKTQGASKQVKNHQFLENTKFYLDIRNRVQLAKTESTLKSYGAKIEPFFTKDIKIVVTDRAEWIGSGQSPTTSISPLTTPSPSSNQDQRFAVPKSRASAMLEKVSRQPASPYSVSALELAQKWRIPVLPVHSLRKWIVKAEGAFIAKLNEKKKQKELLESPIVVYTGNSPFIKIESFVSPNLPEFVELGSWPRLNLDGHLGQCPFSSPNPPSSSDEQPEETENKLFQVKDKVAVEFIQYDTDFRIKDNLDTGECRQEKPEAIDETEKQSRSSLDRCFVFSKMTRRPAKSNVVNNEDETANIADSKQSLSPLCNGHAGRSITRQSSQELLKVQCNGLTTSHRNSKLLSPSGSDVLPLPSSRRSTRRASASWCGSTRELSQLSPTDSEIENIRRSDSSFETNDASLDSPGITLRPKGQLWLPIALIGTTAEENGNCIRKRFDYSVKQSDNAKLSSETLDPVEEKKDEVEENQTMPKVLKENETSVNSNSAVQNEHQGKKISEKYCIITRNTKMKNIEVNGRSRESSVESHKSDPEQPKSRTDGKKRSLSVCDRVCPVKRSRTMSTNSVHLVGKKKKLSPEEKLLQDNKEYFKMEVLNTKLRSSGSLLNVTPHKEPEVNEETAKPIEKIDKIIIKKIKLKRKRKNKWSRRNHKKVRDNNYATIVLDNKKNNVKINGVIKKKRQSELMKLCNEAESFMFGESSGQSTGHGAESEREESPRKTNNSSSLHKVSLPENPPTDNSYESEGKSRKKRRSHAEAFIHDNLDYYKFETPGSRLRYQGSFLDVKSEDKDFIYTMKQKKKERLSTEQNRKNELLERLHLSLDVKEEKLESQEKKRNPIKPSDEIEKILFSFERIPAMEPWYEVYKRQDEGMENYFPLLSDPNDQPFLLPYELPKPAYSKSSAVSDYYKRRRKKLAHLFNHPRKSPRCHASTLAILSSLKRRKRRSGTNISANAVVAESPQKTNSQPPDDKQETKCVEAECEEILNFLYNDELNGETAEVLLEPLSDSEGRPKRKSSDSCRSVKSDEEDWRTAKTGSRSKRSARLESHDADAANEHRKAFSFQSIEPDPFFKDMTIEVRKKSGLNVNITTILENIKKSPGTGESNGGLIPELNGDSAAGDPDRIFRKKRRKARKINRTGWDMRKTRRRTGNKLSEVKEVESEAVTVKPKRTKPKPREDGISSENIIVGSTRRGTIRTEDVEKKVPEPDNKPVLRSNTETANLTRNSQDRESQSSSMGSTSREYLPCVVRVKKISESVLGRTLRLKCSNGRYAIQKRRVILSRKKKRVIDYAWTTKRR